MIAKQISIFVENRSGRLASVISLLSENKINIRALSLADTESYGVLRLIVDQTEKAQEVLKENKITTSLTDVLAVSINDTPGGLSGVLSILSENGTEVEYAYAFISKKENEAAAILRVEDAKKAEEALIAGGFKGIDGISL